MHVFALTEQVLKMNLHMHTSQSKSWLSPLDALKSYEDAGYDAVWLTDHRMLTLVPPRRDSEGTRDFIGHVASRGGLVFCAIPTGP